MSGLLFDDFVLKFLFLSEYFKHPIMFFCKFCSFGMLWCMDHHMSTKEKCRSANFRLFSGNGSIFKFFTAIKCSFSNVF